MRLAMVQMVLANLRSFYPMAGHDLMGKGLEPGDLIWWTWWSNLIRTWWSNLMMMMMGGGWSSTNKEFMVNMKVSVLLSRRHVPSSFSGLLTSCDICLHPWVLTHLIVTFGCWWWGRGSINGKSLLCFEPMQKPMLCYERRLFPWDELFTESGVSL